MIHTDDGYFNLDVFPLEPRIVPVTFTPASKIKDISDIAQGKKIIDELNYLISDQNISFQTDGTRRQTFLVPQGKAAEVRITQSEIYNSPLTLNKLMFNEDACILPDISLVLASLDNEQSVKSSGEVNLLKFDCGFYPTQDSIMSVLASFAQSLGLDLNWSYAANNSLQFVWTASPRAYLALPVGDFDLKKYLNSDLVGISPWKTTITPDYKLSMMFMGNPGDIVPDDRNYQDTVINTLANKLGMLDFESFKSNFKQGTSVFFLDYPDLDEFGRIRNVNIRHIIMISRFAGGFGDLWGSLADVFIVSTDTRGVNTQFFPLARLNLSFAPPYSTALGSLDNPWVPLTTLGGIDGIKLKIVDLLQNPVMLTNGYPSCTMAFRAV